MRRLIVTPLVALALPAAALAHGHGSASHGKAKETAAAACRSERSGMGRDTFRATYGTNHSKRNAFGKCVAKMRHEPSGDRKAKAEADVNAAGQCRKERTADPAAFRDKYGTNHNKRNAFGKCVSKTAKAQMEQGSRPTS